MPWHRYKRKGHASQRGPCLPKSNQTLHLIQIYMENCARKLVLLPNLPVICTIFNLSIYRQGYTEVCKCPRQVLLPGAALTLATHSFFVLWLFLLAAFVRGKYIKLCCFPCLFVSPLLSRCFF
jgi:hypothetical protein